MTDTMLWGPILCTLFGASECEARQPLPLCGRGGLMVGQHTLVVFLNTTIHYWGWGECIGVNGILFVMNMLEEMSWLGVHWLPNFLVGSALASQIN